jgi:hypothetical protein
VTQAARPDGAAAQKLVFFFICCWPKVLRIHALSVRTATVGGGGRLLVAIVRIWFVRRPRVVTPRLHFACCACCMHMLHQGDGSHRDRSNTSSAHVVVAIARSSA